MAQGHGGTNTNKYRAIHEDYDGFVKKFNQSAPKTTDDCYTPENVYATVLDWCVETYGLQARKIMRPFYPGGDYQNEDYSGKSVVIDNPPFSMLAEILRFYAANGVDFFLFAPGLTMFDSEKELRQHRTTCKRGAEIWYNPTLSLFRVENITQRT